MSSRLVKLTSTDGESVFTVVVNASSVAFMKPITISKVVKTKVVFNGGAEVNIVESIEEAERKIKGDAGQIVPFRRD